MRDARLLAVVAALALTVSGASTAGAARTTGCAPRTVSAGYEARLARVLARGTDVLGRRLLSLPGGPTYAAAAETLPPLRYARTSGRRPLTRTGVYYVPSAEPGGVQGAGSPMLLVADGSDILYGSVSGPRLSVEVGAAHELFGSCARRASAARLAAGYLPVVRTGYVDAAGARYTQESFGGRDASGATVAYLLISSARGSIRIVTRAGTLSARRSLAVAWAPERSARPRIISSAEYAAARRATDAYWASRLADGGLIEVPERVVMDAERATLIQDLMLTWRYSIGNPYEEFSFPESVDGAQVMAEYGFADVANAMLRTSLTRRPQPYANWKMGEKLLGVATAYRLSRDASALDAATPRLAGYVHTLARQLGDDGLLQRERYSSDIADDVLGLHAQATAWRGLHEVALAWGASGDHVNSAVAAAAARRLRAGLLRAVGRSERLLPDGARFIAMRLLDGERAYPLLPASRDGSYWNLVAPYALASGLFSNRPALERGAFRFMLSHGSRLVGVVRAGAFSLYGPGTAASGTDQVYGLNAARFLADLDAPDQIILSLYGQLATAMTPHTFIAGEAASVTPIGRAYYRSMYLPPNSVSNAAFLETLRSTVVHELPDGRGLELAYATPRAWLEPGKRIAVTRLPTSFGPLSYALQSGTGGVSATIAVPRIGRHILRLRLRLPGGRRIASVRVGGRPVTSFDARTATIDLTGRGATLQLEVSVAR